MVSLNNFKKFSLDDKLGILLFLGSFIFVGIMIWACSKISLTYDTAFSLILIKNSYYDLVIMTMNDVHPPLYYFILKFVVDLFQVFDLSVGSTIIISKFVSVVPFVLLLVLSFFKVREYWGWLCCGVFAVCLTSMPQLMYYSVNIRMYSWALFFVTICFIYAYAVIKSPELKNWFILVFSGVCAAYTHYFAAVSTIFIFLLLLTYFVINNKNEIKKWLIAVNISFALYLFWLFTLFNQLITVTTYFWIEPLNLNVIFNYLGFIFSPSKIFQTNIEIIGILLAMSYLIVFIYYIIKFEVKWKSYENFILLGFFVLFLTVIFGIIVSISLRPLFISRYMFPSLGIFWLTFAFLLSRMWGYKKVFVPVLCVVLIVSCMSTITFINFEDEVHNNYAEFDSFIKQDSIKNDNFIADTNGTNLLNEFGPGQYLLLEYHNKDLSDLNLTLKDNKTIWLFSSKDFNLILKNCTKQNMTIKKYKSYNGFAQDTYNNSPYTIYTISN